MPLGAIVLVLISASIHVGWNFLAKSSSSPKTFTLLMGIIPVALLAVSCPVIPWASIPFDAWIFIFFSGVIHSVYFIALGSAYEKGDISYVYPIARSAPAFVPITAFFFLGERISMRGLSGIAIVILCVFLIQLRGEARTGFEKFWFSIKQKESLWAFVTLGAVVFYTVVDKAGMLALSRVTDISPGWHGPIYYLIEITICYFFFLIYSGKSIWPTAICVSKHEWLQVLVAALSTMVSYSLILHVMQTENVSYIVTLRQSSILLSVLVGRFALKEPYGRSRIMIACVMLWGFFLVATAE